MLKLGTLVAVLLLAGSAYAQLNTCVSCQFFVGTLIGSLPSNPNVTTIAARLDKLCETLPSMFSNQCHQFVKNNRDNLIQFLSSGRSPEAVCKALKLCSANAWNGAAADEYTPKKTEGPLVVNAQFKTEDTSCDFCTFVMWQVQTTLKDNYTIGNIANTLNTICLNLPVGQHECLQFVQSYFPLLVKYLSAHDTALQVCKLLGQCTNSSMDANTLMIEDQKTMARAIVRHYVATHPLELAAQSSSGCQLCQWIVSAGEAWLSDGHNEAEISNFLQQVCDFFNQYAAQCQQLVAVYTPKVIEMLVENYTPPYVCGQIGGCSP